MRPAPRRTVALAVALATVVVALASPLHDRADELFSAHMVQHLLLVVVAAPLLAVGKPLTLGGRVLPLTVRRTLGRHRRVAFRRLAVPVAVAVVWALHIAALTAWHLPGLYQAALERPLLHALEHGTLLATGYGFWAVATGPTVRRTLGGWVVLHLFGAFVVGGALGAVITLAPEPLYDYYVVTAAALDRDALADQQLAGVLMWVPPSLVYAGAAGWYFSRWLGGVDEDVAL